jgi:hypothetical protein
MNASHVTLHVWRVPPRRLPKILWRMVVDRGRLRRTPGVRFAKLLGTGRGRWFGPTRADPTRWATLVVWDADLDRANDQQPAIDLEATQTGRAWRALSSSYCRIDLAPLATRGSWAGQDPFTSNSDETGGQPTDGMVLAITRARLRPTRAVAFWRAIGEVAVAAHRAPGLLAAFGIGEAPIGWQGTVSLWRGTRDLVEFAYRHPDHRKAIEQTSTQRWYAEELFARFVVLEVTGDRGVIGWIDDREDCPKHQERKSL